jgi:hypothetical protein
VSHTRIQEQLSIEKRSLAGMRLTFCISFKEKLHFYYYT